MLTPRRGVVGFVQDILSAVIPNCEAAQGWASESFGALNSLRAQMLRYHAMHTADLLVLLERTFPTGLGRP